MEYIIHSGIKGQKWGQRRYRNPDGTLTPEGRRRYKKYDKSEDQKKYEEISRKDYRELSNKELTEEKTRRELAAGYNKAHPHGVAKAIAKVTAAVAAIGAVTALAANVSTYAKKGKGFFDSFKRKAKATERANKFGIPQHAFKNEAEYLKKTFRQASKTFNPY